MVRFDLGRTDTPDGNSGNWANLISLPELNRPNYIAQNCSVSIIDVPGSVIKLHPGAVELGNMSVCLRTEVNQPNYIQTTRIKTYPPLDNCECDLPSNLGFEFLGYRRACDKVFLAYQENKIGKDDRWLLDHGFDRSVQAGPSIEISTSGRDRNEFNVYFQPRTVVPFNNQINIKPELIGLLNVPAKLREPTLVQSFCSKEEEIVGVLLQNPHKTQLLARIRGDEVLFEINRGVETPKYTGSGKKEPVEIAVTALGIVVPVQSNNPFLTKVVIIDFRS